ncbi:MAG: carbon storage regulator [bacterium]|nr:carbon storage regulator [bacterium]
MLVLSRKENEGVMIGDNMEVVVLEIKHGKVRLGFRIPGTIKVLRTELYDAPPAEGTAATHCQAG